MSLALLSLFAVDAVRWSRWIQIALYPVRKFPSAVKVWPTLSERVCCNLPGTGLVAQLGYQLLKPGSPRQFLVASGYRATTKWYSGNACSLEFTSWLFKSIPMASLLRKLYCWFVSDLVNKKWSHLWLETSNQVHQTEANTKIKISLIFNHYRSGMLNSNTVNSKFHLIQMFGQIVFATLFIFLCLKCIVNLNFTYFEAKPCWWMDSN